METKLNELKSILNEVADLNQAAALLGWDQQTYMPAGSAATRGQQLSTLGKIAHIKFTSEIVGKLLEELQTYAADLDPNSDDARLIKVTRRNYDKQIKVPAEMVAEFAQATTLAQQAWQEARAENNFKKFQPHLKKVMDLRRRYAKLFAPYEHIYDPLLDDFEPGLKTAEVQEIFNTLRPQQVALIKAIAGRPQVDDSFIHLQYDPKKQWALVHLVVSEEHMTQHFWVTIKKVKDFWRICKADGQTFFPTPGIARAVEFVYDMAKKSL